MYMNDRHVKVLLYLITFSQTLKLKVLVFTCHFFQPTCGVQLSHSYHDIRRCMVLPFFWGNLVWGNDCNSRRFTLHELGFFFFLISRISNSYSVSLLSCATAKSPTGPFHRLLASAVVNRSSFGKYEAPSPFFLLKLLDNFAQKEKKRVTFICLFLVFFSSKWPLMWTCTSPYPVLCSCWSSFCNLFKKSWMFPEPWDKADSIYLSVYPEFTEYIRIYEVSH